MTIEEFIALPYEFAGFIDSYLSNGEIHLECTKQSPADPVKKYVPAYHFDIKKADEKVGEINLRIGYTEGLYYGGNIGYGIEETYRGNGYAVEACKLVSSIAKGHGMRILFITNDALNTASRRVCEKLGAQFIEKVALPEWTDLYKEGQRFSNIFAWEI